MLWMSPTPLPLQSGDAAATEKLSPIGTQSGSWNTLPLTFCTSDETLVVSDTLALAKKKYRAEPVVFSSRFFVVVLLFRAPCTSSPLPGSHSYKFSLSIA